MSETGLQPAPFWEQCVRELKIRHSRFRLRRHAASPYIYVREMDGGRKVNEFSLQPRRWCNRDDIEEARDLCIQGHRQGSWPVPQTGPAVATGPGWSELAEACIADIKLRICKEGSRAHAINDLRKRISHFKGPVEAKRLQAWVLEHDPRLQLKSFNRRIETLSQIHRSGQMDLTAELQRLRDLRPKGAAEKIRKASSMRVRVIPGDEDLQHWLDRLEPFHQWVFGCIATYGLRPHELWHAEGIDSQGWISIPGDMKTKTGEHFAPPVPEAWVERYGLRQNWEQFHGQLNARWTVRFVDVSGVKIAVNNVAVSNSRSPLESHDRRRQSADASRDGVDAGGDRRPGAVAGLAALGNRGSDCLVDLDNCEALKPLPRITGPEAELLALMAQPDPGNPARSLEGCRRSHCQWRRSQSLGGNMGPSHSRVIANMGS